MTRACAVASGILLGDSGRARPAPPDAVNSSADSSATKSPEQTRLPFSTMTRSTSEVAVSAQPPHAIKVGEGVLRCGILIQLKSQLGQFATAPVRLGYG
jgi:hypothetical protein